MTIGRAAPTRRHDGSGRPLDGRLRDERLGGPGHPRRAASERRVAVLSGAALGAFCLVADRLDLVDWVEQLASTWVLVAAYAGSRAASYRRAAVAGLLALLTATAVYYGGFVAALASPTVVAMWGLIAIVVGPVAGTVGRAALRGRARTRVASAALLAASLVAEPLALWSHLDHRDVRAVFVVMVVLGVALPGVVLRDEPVERRSIAVFLAVAGGLLAAPVLEIVFSAVGLV